MFKDLLLLDLSRSHVPVSDRSGQDAKFRLARDESCIQDVDKHCGKVNQNNNFAVFICLQEKAQVGICM